MRHPVISRLSALLIGWVAFLSVAIAILLANPGLANTQSFPLIGAVTIAAALAGAAAYLATSTALASRGAAANWCTFLLAALFNVAAFAFLATSDGAGEHSSPSTAPPEDRAPPAPAEETILPSFPWPPPRASSQAVLQLGPPAGTLGTLDQNLSMALGRSGYVERSYFAVPGGFALVTRLEQTYPDGRPREGDDRWAVSVGRLREFSLAAYLKALFTANPGYYRVLVFIVTSNPFPQSDAPVSRGEAIEWLAAGLNVLPPALGEQPLTNRHRATVLVYEFEQPQASSETTVAVPGRLTARTHLERSALWRELGQ